MSKGQINKRYTLEFKIKVVETMREEKLSCREAGKKLSELFLYEFLFKNITKNQ